MTDPNRLPPDNEAIETSATGLSRLIRAGAVVARAVGDWVARPPKRNQPG